MNAGNAMLGFTAQREKWATNGFMSMQADGSYKAWWQNDSFPYAYPGAIPVVDVYTKLLDWHTQECDIAVKLYLPTGDERTLQAHGQDDKGHFIWVQDPEHKAIVREDSEVVFGYFGQESYEKHDYIPLIEQCAKIADGELGVASAFLMDHGAVFIIGMELPEDITTTEGIEHRVRLQASTSQNGRFATRFDVVDEFAVCSNSFRLNLNKADKSGKSFTVKHTSRSLGRIMDAHQALGLVYKATEEFNLFLDSMTKVDITDQQFQTIVDGLVAIPDAKFNDNGDQTNKGAQTIADGKRDKLRTMYCTDHRCKRFTGTLFGAFQTWSTWNQWERPTGDHLEASIMGTLTGKFTETDTMFFDLVKGLDDIDMRPLVEAASK